MSGKIVVAIILLIIGFFAGLIVSNSLWKSSAIRAGVGRHTCDKEGNIKWIWTPDAENRTER